MKVISVYSFESPVLDHALVCDFGGYCTAIDYLAIVM
jgi:hypothetical protein